MKEVLELPCIRLEQTKKKYLYSFAVDGKLVPRFASVSRISRDEEAKVQGYQRPEVISHIAEIRDYVESASPMIPNAVVVAFDSRVKFRPNAPASRAGQTVMGTLTIPLTPEDSENHAGFIVDGQQRLAAIRDAKVNAFSLFVTAFVTDDVTEQTEQFILVNSTKPLPKGLLYELLPVTSTKLPKLLQRRRKPAEILDRLNRDQRSPFHRLIKTPTNPDGIVSDNALLRMLENSLSDGALYRFRATSKKDEDHIVELLAHYWEAVRDVFPDAWAKPPKRSRLMHGAGIVSLGLIMDAIADRHRDQKVPDICDFRSGLEPISPHCRWTDGYWVFGVGQTRKWNEIQNTSKDIALLSDYLLTVYRASLAS